MKIKINKKLLIITGSVLGGIAVTAGIVAAVAGSGKKPVYVYSYDIAGMSGGYWGDSQQTYGPVRSDNIQTVMLSDTQTVTSINVKEGDTVKKDDILLTFDSTLSELALEKKRLAVEQLKLQLQQEKERLQEINNLQPYKPVEPKYTWVPSTGVDGFGAGEVYIPNSGTDVKTWKGRLGTSEEDAMILWMKDGNSLNGDIIQAAADFLEKARDYWNEYNYEQLYEAYQKELEQWREAGEDPDTEPQEPVQPESGTVRDFYMILKQVPGDNTATKAKVYFGMHAILSSAGEWIFVPFDASGISDYTKTGTEGHNVSSGGSNDNVGTTYTLEEIVKMRQDQQKAILDVEYKIKVAEAEYSIAQRETKDGKVRSEVDGKVISVLTPEEAKEKKQPVIKVSGGGGYYVVGTISELERDKLAIGSEVTITDNRTGNMCTGTVESIGDYPTQSSGNSGSGNSSYYPFNVFVDESADLVGGNYVSISYELEESGSGIYLTNAFIRKIDGQNCVFVQGADGKLEKRVVTTGKSLWGSYKEVLSGITTEDMIAFPYGKNVKEGAQTQVGDYSTLYGE